MTYMLTITERQAQVISTAVEILARLGMGQWRDGIEHMPLKRDYNTWYQDLAAIGSILRKHMIDNVDGWTRTHGIHSDAVTEHSRMAWDIHQAIRHRLAWDKAVKEGIVQSIDSPREWTKMMAVNYDEPIKACAEPLAKIELSSNDDNKKDT